MAANSQPSASAWQTGAKAAEKALHDISRYKFALSHSSGILATITGSSNLTMDDYNAAVRAIHESVPVDLHILVAVTVDEAFGENVRIFVMAN